MTKYVFAFTEGDKDQKDLLGGKGANLAEMVKLGIPVPPGFTISTEACRAYLVKGAVPDALSVEVTTALRQMEVDMDKWLGDAEDPLLLSVRSGAKFSMPGMMETVLNIGLNDKTVEGLEKKSGSARFAWDSYRRLIQMFSKTVLDIDGDLFSDVLEAAKDSRGITQDTDLDVEALKEIVAEFKAIVERESGTPFPQDPRDQMDEAIEAVFRSWNTDRAKIYRRRERIPHDLGTAVNVQAMVFGNMGEKSGTGVCFTRDPSTGQAGVYGDYLVNAQGEDVVAGIRNTLPLDALKELDVKAYNELMMNLHMLETHYRDMCDIEFTVEEGKLWLLQTRVGKRTASAAFRIASQLVNEKLITRDEALTRVNGEQLTQLLFPQFDEDVEKDVLTKGMAASPGAAVGEVVFNNAQAVERTSAGADVILVRRETNPDDLEGMVVASGILTARGGKTSHAAVVARGMGRCCVVGAEELYVDESTETVTIRGSDRTIKAGDIIAIDGTSGYVYAGDVPVAPSPVSIYLEEGLEAGREAAQDEATKDLVTSVDLILAHADTRARLSVRANADAPEDVARARKYGAVGIGLCRTEHMFLGDRRQLIEKVILAETSDEQDEAFAELGPLQRGDFVGVLEAMDGLPTTIRLIDPPLHEFLPDITDLTVKIAVKEATGVEVTAKERQLLKAVREHHEQNPMLGLRGVRLGLKIRGLFALQIRAIAEAAADRVEAGGDPKPEIMVPLVGSVRELQIIREDADEIIASVEDSRGLKLDIQVGAMIELPRAAITADSLTEEADFFSFGTNDLTQTAWGFSRDDVEATFFNEYFDLGVFGVSPFESIDVRGVGKMVAIGVENAHRVKPDIKCGVCGEHGGDPESIHFFDAVGLDYVSCSPFRVPVARLEAGRAAVSNESMPWD